MRPGIGRNASCTLGDCFTSRPKGRSWPRELWLSIHYLGLLPVWAGDWGGGQETTPHVEHQHSSQCSPEGREGGGGKEGGIARVCTCTCTCTLICTVIWTYMYMYMYNAHEYNPRFFTVL